MRAKEKHFSKSLINKIIVFIIITVALGVSLLFSTQIDKLLNINTAKTGFSYTEFQGLKISFVDVGQGDCTFVEFPDGKTLLVDAGPKENLDGLKTYFNNINFTQGRLINYVIATHAHADHIDNMPYIFSKYRVEKVYLPKVSSSITTFNAGYKSINNTKAYANFLNAVQSENCAVSYYAKNEMITGSFNDKEYILKFWTKHEDNASIKENNFSPIITISYNGKSFCLTGDAETEVENAVLDTTIGTVDVYKAGHHGSSTSSSQKFLDLIKPRYVVISVGENNTYGHPTTSVLARFANSAYITDIFRTDINGSVFMCVSNSGEFNIAFTKDGSTNFLHWYMFAAAIEAVSAILIFSISFSKKSKKSNKNRK